MTVTLIDERPAVSAPGLAEWVGKNLQIKGCSAVHATAEGVDASGAPAVFPGCNIGIGLAGRTRDRFRATDKAVNCMRFGCLHSGTTVKTPPPRERHHSWGVEPALEGIHELLDLDALDGLPKAS